MYADTVKLLWSGEGTRVLCIEGFTRKNSCTKRLQEDFLQGLGNGCDVKHYNVYDAAPHACTGCNACEAGVKCVYDDLDEFFALMETADILIFSSPVYNLSFPAPLKALIDRFQVYYTGHFTNEPQRRIAKRRKAYLLACAGHDGTEGFGVMERQLKNAFSILNAEYAGGTLRANTDFE